MNTRTHDVGPIFVYRYTDVPRWAQAVHFAQSWEEEKPYRFGRSVTLHLPGSSKAYGIGFWWSLGIRNQEELDGWMFGRTPHDAEVEEEEMLTWD